MKYPKIIKLGGQPNALLFGPLNKLHGQYDPNNLKITISSDIPAAVAAETVTHECLHAACHISGLTREKWFKKIEEPVVDRISPLLLLWIAQNPKLIACLQEAMES